jgi:hypothetical protein
MGNKETALPSNLYNNPPEIRGSAHLPPLTFSRKRKQKSFTMLRNRKKALIPNPSPSMGKRRKVAGVILPAPTWEGREAQPTV